MQNILRTDLAFRQMLAQLYHDQSIDKNDPLVSQLDITAKYALIRMKGKGLLKFDDNRISLTDQSKESMNILTEVRLVG